MKTLYLDIFSGLSGDMFLGAMLDLGVDADALRQELRKLGVGGYHLHSCRGRKCGIAGTRFEVHLDHHADHGHDAGDSHARTGGESAPPCGAHHHTHDSSHAHGHAHETEDHTREPAHVHTGERTFASIRDLIGRSAITDWVKQRAIDVFGRVARAEGRIHGVPPEQVHFHEVGAVDSIVDIVGACIALDMLGRPRVLAGPVVEGTGFIRCAHGRYPLPAPATLAILGERGIPITQCAEPHELVTPTGAALLAEFSEDFGPLQGLVAGRIGFGLGARDHHTRPNVVRAILGEAAGTTGVNARDWQSDHVAVLETNLDDVSGEVLGHFVEQALAAGALDVFHTPIQMKKSRPGVLLTVLCTAGDADRFTELMLRETTTFGVRRTLAERRTLQRRFTHAETPWGTVQIKEGLLDGRVLHAVPEYESCRQLAAAAQVPVREVFEAAQRAVVRSPQDAPTDR